MRQFVSFHPRLSARRVDAQRPDPHDRRAARPSTRCEAADPARRRHRRGPLRERRELRRARQGSGQLGEHHDADAVGDRGGRVHEGAPERGPRAPPHAQQRVEHVSLGRHRAARQGAVALRAGRHLLVEHGHASRSARSRTRSSASCARRSTARTRSGSGRRTWTATCTRCTTRRSCSARTPRLRGRTSCPSSASSTRRRTATRSAAHGRTTSFPTR